MIPSERFYFGNVLFKSIVSAIANLTTAYSTETVYCKGVTSYIKGSFSKLQIVTF